MKIIIKTTNLELTSAIKEHVEQKIGSVDKLLDDMDRNVIEARVEIGRITKHHRKGDIFRAEVNLTLPGRLLRSVAEEGDLRTALDQVKNELQQEIKKYRGKKEAQYKRGARKAKKLIRLSPLAWFKRRKGSREKEEGV
jgi:putative sigma-54 modulation protein